MKKFAKMSLAAAVALAGLTSTAGAASLEEAIKGVDISGKVRYRMEDKSGSAQEDQDVNIDVTLKIPVTDTITFVSNMNIDNDNQEDQFHAAGSNSIYVDDKGTDSEADDTLEWNNSQGFNLDNYYFQYVNGPVTGLLGTFDIPGRLTDALTGSGAAVLYNVGGFTVGYGAMYNSEASSEMINTVLAMGTVGPVSLLGQYVDVDDVMGVYNLKADVTAGPVMVGAEYSEKDLDADTTERETLKAYVKGTLGIVSATATYAETGKDGGGSIDNAAETPAEYLMWQLGSAAFSTELEVASLDVTVSLTDAVSIRAAIADGEYMDGTTKTDITETLGQINYSVAKNLNTYVRVSELDEDGEEKVTRGRVEVKYSF